MGGDIKAGHTKKLSVGIHIAREKAWINMIAEKYARAIGSSHLEWKVEPSAIDTLTAARREKRPPPDEVGGLEMEGVCS